MAVTKSEGMGISPGYDKYDPQLLSWETKEKSSQMNIFSCSIPT